jgi:hypothetical protein
VIASEGLPVEVACRVLVRNLPGPPGLQGFCGLTTARSVHICVRAGVHDGPFGPRFPAAACRLTQFVSARACDCRSRENRRELGHFASSVAGSDPVLCIGNYLAYAQPRLDAANHHLLKREQTQRYARQVDEASGDGEDFRA